VTGYLFTAIWPVTTASLKLPALQLVAEQDLLHMLAEQDLLLCGEPQWTLAGDRLSCVAPARRRNPWDVPAERAAKAYVVDLVPDPQLVLDLDAA